MDAPDFQRALAEGRALQARLAGLSPVAVGDTAAALHCGHRFSLDVDVVTDQLRAHFAETTTNLESWAGWRTNRVNPPVLILGEHGGVELGVRQLRRAVPLHTTRLSELVVPTAGEMLRVKAFLLTEQRAPQTWVSAFAEACESDPVDLPAIPLAAYKGLRAPFTDWPFVAGESRKLGRALLKLELEGSLASALPPHWSQDEQA